MKRPIYRPGYWGGAFFAAMTTATMAMAAPETGQGSITTGQHYQYAHHGISHGPLTLLFIVVVIIGAIFLMRKCGKICHSHHGHGGPSNPRERSPLDMLKVRFACGEIDEAEYKGRKKVLEDE